MSWSDAMLRLLGYRPRAVAATIDRHQTRQRHDDRLACEALTMAGVTEGDAVVLPQCIYRTDGKPVTAVMRV